MHLLILIYTHVSTDTHMSEPANRWVRMLCVMEMTGHLHRIIVPTDNDTLEEGAVENASSLHSFDFAGLGAGNPPPFFVQYIPPPLLVQYLPPPFFVQYVPPRSAQYIHTPFSFMLCVR